MQLSQSSGHREFFYMMPLCLPKTAELVRLAKPVLSIYVDKLSVERGRITLLPQTVLTKVVDITQLRVPPHAPKEKTLKSGTSAHTGINNIPL